MARVAPPVFVDTPTATPPRFGLLSVADMPVPTDPHWVNGVEYHPNPVVSGRTSPTDCATTYPPLSPDNGIPLDTGYPIKLTVDFTTKSVGISRDEVNAYAAAKMAVSEGPLLEAQVWGAADTRIMDASTVALNSTAVPLAEGVGLLEAWLRSVYGGLGVLHLPSQVAMLLGSDRLMVSGNKITTILGTPLAFGNYAGTSPSGATPAAGQVWIAATGAVTVRRSEVAVHTANGPTSFINPKSNDVLGVAERTYVVTFDAAKAAVLVNAETVVAGTYSGALYPQG